MIGRMIRDGRAASCRTVWLAGTHSKAFSMPSGPPVLGLRSIPEFTTETNADHRLLVGPWYHIPWTQQVGAVDFGDDARNFVDEYQLAWLDFWTKGRHGAFDALPPVRVFVTGSKSGMTRNAGRCPPQKIRPGICEAKGAPIR